MTTATQTRKASKPSKGRRDVTKSDLPLHDNGKIDLVAVLQFALTAPGRLSNCYNRFHRYSMLNILLVLMQTGQFEPIATFRKWQSLDRKVISGPGSALWVNHPQFAPLRDHDGNTILKANGKAEMKVVGFYPKASVFQLFQTEGPDLPMPTLPSWDRKQAADVLDVTETRFSHHDGNVQGYSVDRKFALNPVAVSPFKTMIHEWAHILLGHTEDHGTKKEHPRDIREFQAEAVALLVCTELDVEQFDAASSRAYIQGWLKGSTVDYLDDDGNLAVNDNVVRSIFSVTDKILVAGRKSHYDQLEPDYN
jgi:hypothetical protein